MAGTLYYYLFLSLKNRKKNTVKKPEFRGNLFRHIELEFLIKSFNYKTAKKFSQSKSSNTF